MDIYIAAHPGLGKSTFAREYPDVIDADFGHYWSHALHRRFGFRPHYWEVPGMTMDTMRRSFATQIKQLHGVIMVNDPQLLKYTGGHTVIITPVSAGWIRKVLLDRAQTSGRGGTVDEHAVEFANSITQKTVDRWLEYEADEKLQVSSHAEFRKILRMYRALAQLNTGDHR